MNTDAVQKCDCPKCGQKAGSYCRTPKGHLTQGGPHIERLLALKAMPGFNLDDYTGWPGKAEGKPKPDVTGQKNNSASISNLLRLT
jgi:hypothetical protein